VIDIRSLLNDIIMQMENKIISTNLIDE